MCNHYRNHPDAISTWQEYIGWDLYDRLPEPDLWPKRQALVVRIVDNRKALDSMAWGVPLTLPGKRPGTTITKHVTNVRNLASPYWKSLLAAPAQRCLVPFTSFAEPKLNAGREEHWFAVKDGPLSAFAGVWRATGAGHAFAFLTCEPNPLVAPLHPKAMPVILHPGDYDRWLSTDFADACTLAAPFPSQLMIME
ncbi:SOS response-associated peptidase family protein [Novosphingobium lentum]|uniref:SOS response-associated peptidase family protein n=1 Tax=Novosphingobium lentum TaxID=145287 RepID=UPI000836AE8F|nr:SOS response-associated peptidase family protein [Novosphingobium lentum]